MKLSYAVERLLVNTSLSCKRAVDWVAWVTFRVADSLGYVKLC